MPATMTIDAVFLHPDDNTCVAARTLHAGTEVNAGGRTVTLSEPVRLGHKIALAPIPSGRRVLKYGQTIGFATADIRPGDWVHSHNVTAGEFDRDYAYASEVPPDPPPLAGRTFQGYRRASGKAAPRNYLAVVSSVNC